MTRNTLEDIDLNLLLPFKWNWIRLGPQAENEKNLANFATLINLTLFLTHDLLYNLGKQDLIIDNSRESSYFSNDIPASVI